MSSEGKEDACYVPPGSAVIGTQVGNWMWRSLEAHAQGPVNMPSDMFSFSLVVSSLYKCRVYLTLSVYLCSY
jgi:hypothetical protein